MVDDITTNVESVTWVKTLPYGNQRLVIGYNSSNYLTFIVNTNQHIGRKSIVVTTLNVGTNRETTFNTIKPWLVYNDNRRYFNPSTHYYTFGDTNNNILNLVCVAIVCTLNLRA